MARSDAMRISPTEHGAAKLVTEGLEWMEANGREVCQIARLPIDSIYPGFDPMGMLPTLDEAARDRGLYTYYLTVSAHTAGPVVYVLLSKTQRPSAEEIQQLMPDYQPFRPGNSDDPSTGTNATSEADTWQDNGGSVDTRQSR